MLIPAIILEGFTPEKKLKRYLLFLSPKKKEVHLHEWIDEIDEVQSKLTPRKLKT